MSECSVKTTLNTEEQPSCYTYTRYNFSIPQKSVAAEKKPIFATKDGSTVDQSFEPFGHFQELEQMVSPNDCSSLEEFRLKIALWRSKLQDASRTTGLPVPIGHTVFRPLPPQIVKPEEMADFSARRKLVRNFNAETSPLSNVNDLHFADVMQKGLEFDPESAFPYPGLNDSDVLMKYHVANDIPWCSNLIPQRPDPTLFKTFAEYEAATMRWCESVGSLDTYPPTAKEVGEITDLTVEGKVELSPPPRPVMMAPKIPPLHQDEPNWKMIKKTLGKLQKRYEKAVREPKLNEPNLSKGVMKPAHVKMNAVEIVESMCQYGVPVSDVKDGLTNALRRERAMLDVGAMCDTMFTRSGRATKDIDKALDLLEEDPKAFIKLDWGTKDFEKALNMAIKSNKDKAVGVYISSMVSLEDVINMSFISMDDRSTAKYSVLVQYFLRIPDMQNKIMSLDLLLLERFVELATFTGCKSFPIDVIPEEEIAEACMENPAKETQIELFAMVFRQAHMLYSMYSVVITASEQFYTALSLVRRLVHRSFQKITDIVMSDTMFPMILDGFYSPNEMVHRFYFRLLRMAIMLQYTKTIRVFAGHDLLNFMQKGMHSPVEFLRRDAHSLWQLILHSDTSMALQLQLIQASPSSVMAQIGTANQDYAKFLQSVFSIFRMVEKSFDYVPFPFGQFQEYFKLLISDLNKEQNIIFLCSLLRLCVQEETIYCNNRAVFMDLINQFAQTEAVKLCSNVTKKKLGCLKVLYKIKFLDPEAVLIHDIWIFILTEMCSKKQGVDQQTREECWKIFRNAVLYQKRFVSFILQTPDLAKKMENAFSSIDKGVIDCMISVLPAFARPLRRSFGLDETLKTNLTELWTKLSDPSVLIAGKILATFKSSHNKPELCRTHAAIVDFLLSAWDAAADNPRSVLATFRNAEHIKTELESVFNEVAKMYNRKNN